MNLSVNQQVINATWREQDCNIIIEAGAGSGKTTTLLGLLEMCEYRALFLAFNKSIQEELEQKTRHLQQAKAMTLHALGKMALTEYYRSKQKFVHVISNKNWALIKEFESMNQIRMRRLGPKDRMKLYYSLMDMNDVSRIYLTDDYDEIRDHMKNMDKILTRDDIRDEWAEFLEYRNATYQEKNIPIDFIDMIYLPAVIEDMVIPIQPYYLFVDEVQDLNFAQLRLVDKLLGQGDIQRFVCVGDPRQSIYGFSGSYGGSFAHFRAKPNSQTLPLDICYRCPPNVIEEANKVYNVLRPFKTQLGIVETETNPDMVQPGSLVICRNSNPLLELYFKLIGLGKSCYIKGEDILPGIIRLLKPYGHAKIKQIVEALQDEQDFHKNKDPKSDFDNIQIWKLGQQMDNLRMMADAMGSFSSLKASELLEKIQTVFEEKHSPDTITLCTIHKAKGLEADVVYILNENLIPSPLSKSAQQLQQEQNLKYVARTRAKKEMYYLNL